MMKVANPNEDVTPDFKANDVKKAIISEHNGVPYLISIKPDLNINGLIVDEVRTLIEKDTIDGSINNVRNYLEKSIEKSNKLYLNEKSTDFLARIGLPLSADSSVNAFTHNIANENENVNSSQENSEKSYKQKQLEIIEKFNPRDNTLSSSHTWIDSVDDIHTYDEVANPNEDVTPDFKANDVQNVLDTGEMIVYSSHPIEKGTWVTPSLMEAQNYAENGQIYSERISTNDVAWVDNIQGMYAPVDDTNGVITKDSTGKVLSQEQQKYFANSKDIRYSLGNKVNNDNNVDTNVQNETTRLGDELANHGLTPEQQVQAEYQKNIDVYGAFKNGGEPRVDRIVPQATDYGKNSEFARNMAESQTVDDSHFKELQEAVNNGAFAYVESSNKAL